VTRASLDVTPDRTVNAGELEIACQVIRRSGVLKVLEPLVIEETGRKRRLSLEALLVALQLNAMRRNHRAHLVQVTRVLNSLSQDQLRRLGVPSWDPVESYDRVERLFSKLASILSAGLPGIDASWFINSVARAGVNKDFLSSHSVAVDGTDVEAWGALHGASRTVELDGEAKETQLIEDGEPTEPLKKHPKNKVKTAKVFGIGPDGRKIYTKDPDARVGHRSATGQRKAGPYVGYELHLAVQTRDVTWTNYIDRVVLSDEVPPVITACSLVPAGSHRTRSIVGQLIESSENFQELKDVVWDPGYSLCQPETAGWLLNRAGIEQTFQVVTHQRGIRPFAGEALLIDGQLYSKFLPGELRDLEMPPRQAGAAQRASYEDKFNLRARWRYVRHSKPDKDGVTRWKCPFCAGILRARAFPVTMRLSRSKPFVVIPLAPESCCCGTLSAPPAELPITQKIPFGTTAWRTSMNRRYAVESANSQLKGGYVDLGRGFFRVFGLVKISFLLGFSLASYNLDRVRSFKARLAEKTDKAQGARKRRLGTWQALMGEKSESLVAYGTGPPG
jgi:hypothetical protein